MLHTGSPASRRIPANGDLSGVLLRALGTWLALLVHHLDPMTREQLFAGI